MVHASMLLELNRVITKMDYSSGNQIGNFFLVIPFKLSKLQMHITRMMSIHFHFGKINLRACEQLLMNAFLDLQHELTVMIQKKTTPVIRMQSMSLVKRRRFVHSTTRVLPIVYEDKLGGLCYFWLLCS